MSSAKKVPAGAYQHKTAGPYSPVLIVDAARLIALSGQAALDIDGNVIGDTVKEQTEATLDNCARLLADAGASFADVFKVNVYLANIDDWERFNGVYRKRMPAPFPARTAIQAVLISPFLVEIEMWAVARQAPRGKPASRSAEQPRGR